MSHAVDHSGIGIGKCMHALPDKGQNVGVAKELIKRWVKELSSICKKVKNCNNIIRNMCEETPEWCRAEWGQGQAQSSCKSPIPTQNKTTKMSKKPSELRLGPEYLNWKRRKTVDRQLQLQNNSNESQQQRASRHATSPELIAENFRTAPIWLLTIRPIASNGTVKTVSDTCFPVNGRISQSTSDFLTAVDLPDHFK